MTHIPDDLVPLPTQPWDERPLELPLSVEETRTAIWRSDGNITRAAQILKVSSNRLRRFVASSPRLHREIEEAREQLVDMAEDVARIALQDPDRQDAMARFVLGTQGRKRGWGSGSNVSVSVDNRSQTNIIQWGDGTTIAVPLQTDMADMEPGEVIEHVDE